MQNIDWLNDDGVNLPMINDFLRNQFYDTIIKDNVRDKHCVDIGFGTGLLSVLAVKHGAKSIVAFEKNPDRFYLGKYILQKLGLEHKIHLINHKFEQSNLNNFPDVQVIFHEVIDSNGWGEGLLFCIPENPQIRFLPNQYLFKVYAAPVSDAFTKSLLTSASNVVGFNPGVDTVPGFVELINSLGFPNHEVQPDLVLESGIMNFDYERETIHGWQLALRYARSLSEPIAWYQIDCQSRTIVATDKQHNYQSTPLTLSSKTQTLQIDTTEWRNQNVLVVPRFGLKDGQAEMMIDTGHWGFLKSPILLVRPTADLFVTHDLHTGAVDYNLL